jgi:hypothetical protein
MLCNAPRVLGSTIDGVAIMKSLKVVTRLTFDDPELLQLLETMFTLMHEHSRGSMAETVSSYNSPRDVKF